MMTVHPACARIMPTRSVRGILGLLSRGVLCAGLLSRKGRAEGTKIGWQPVYFVGSTNKHVKSP